MGHWGMGTRSPGAPVGLWIWLLILGRGRGLIRSSGWEPPFKSFIFFFFFCVPQENGSSSQQMDDLFDILIQSGGNPRSPAAS